MSVAESRNAIFAPAVNARASVFIRKIIPGVAVRAVIFAHRAPLALGQIWPPAFPVHFAQAIFFEPLLFFRHSLCAILLPAKFGLTIVSQSWLKQRRDAAAPAIRTGSRIRIRCWRFSDKT